MESYITQMCVSVNLDEDNKEIGKEISNALMKIRENNFRPKNVFLSSETQKLLFKICANDEYLRLIKYPIGLECAKYKIDDSIKYKRMFLVSDSNLEMIIRSDSIR